MVNNTKAADPRWQKSVLSLYQELSPIIFEHVGTRSFLFSGTLLGFARSKDFISYDKDMDCAYVSLKKTAKSAQAEFAALAMKLIELGYDVTPKASCLAVRKPGNNAAMVDIAMLFIKDDENIGFPFGVASKYELPYRAIFPIQIQEMRGNFVEVPRDPAQVMKVVYGDNWTSPDPEFSWKERRVRRDSGGLLSYSQRSMLASENFYRHHSPLHPSKFSRWIISRPFFAGVTAVLDAGAGNARDTRMLARGGKRVLAVDASKYAVSAGRALLNLRDSTIPIMHADLLATGTFARCMRELRKTNNDTVLVYGRFLLSAITDQQIDVLFGIMSKDLRAGDYLALEFRNEDDLTASKYYFRSFRNFNTIDKIVTSLNSDFRLIESTSGIGLAEFKSEDPHVSRVVLEKI
ncbi:class I SAM-dependent methyltransferase [Glutamicibacter soli]|uniref:class I SAM-dependent methyltransferase n=1 Tax=Glutamicibacter soli TaxID=453836 RepID=UPI0011BDB2AC|nr:class I SAM-dependent methyltransferase [Glutamicibacter soli]